MKIGFVWRVNVGKSTLFNRFLGTYRAIVTDIAWTTRQIVAEQANVEWIGNVELLDSPWLYDFTEELQYIEQIIISSDLLIFVVDGKSWLNTSDQDIQKLILKHGKKDNTLLAVNKLDNKVYLDEINNYLADFYKLWFKNIFPISAKSGQWVDDLQETMAKILKKLWIKAKRLEKDDGMIPIAFVGRPNVGKSTLLNKFFGEELSKVSEVAWTTLDYITCEINFHGRKYKLYDTAWIRRKWKIHWLERIAFEKTIKMLEYVKPVTIFMIDVVEWVTHRDLSLLGEILNLNIPVIIAANKTDEKDKSELENQFKLIIHQFEFAKYLPILPISAKLGTWLPKILEFVEKIYGEFNKRIGTGELNKALNEAWIKTPPRFPKNKVCKLYYASQLDSFPPKFLFFINKEDNANFSFKKWVENVIRRNFGFVWTPLVFEFKQKEWVGRYSKDKD